MLRLRRSSFILWLPDSRVRRVLYETWVGISRYDEVGLVFESLKIAVFKVTLLPKYPVALLSVGCRGSVVNHGLDAH